MQPMQLGGPIRQIGLSQAGGIDLESKPGLLKRLQIRAQVKFYPHLQDPPSQMGKYKQATGLQECSILGKPVRRPPVPPFTKISQRNKQSWFLVPSIDSRIAGLLSPIIDSLIVFVRQWSDNRQYDNPIAPKKLRSIVDSQIIFQTSFTYDFTLGRIIQVQKC